MTPPCTSVSSCHAAMMALEGGLDSVSCSHLYHEDAGDRRVQLQPCPVAGASFWRRPFAVAVGFLQCLCASRTASRRFEIQCCRPRASVRGELLLVWCTHSRGSLGCWAIGKPRYLDRVVDERATQRADEAGGTVLHSVSPRQMQHVYPAGKHAPRPVDPVEHVPDGLELAVGGSEWPMAGFSPGYRVS